MPPEGRQSGRIFCARPAVSNTRITSPSKCTARGSGEGAGSRSTTATLKPCMPSRLARVAPVGPKPTMATSYTRSGAPEAARVRIHFAAHLRRPLLARLEAAQRAGQLLAFLHDLRVAL